jgi:hypothetical protein
MGRLPVSTLDSLKPAIQRVLGRAELRLLNSDQERCVIAAEILNLPLATTANVLGISPQSTHRAKKMMERKRQVGINGRSRALSPAAEAELSHEIQNKFRQGDLVRYPDFLAKVRTTNSP